jgi:hypothetical protein
VNRSRFPVVKPSVTREFGLREHASEAMLVHEQDFPIPTAITVRIACPVRKPQRRRAGGDPPLPAGLETRYRDRASQHDLPDAEKVLAPLRLQVVHVVNPGPEEDKRIFTCLFERSREVTFRLDLDDLLQICRIAN